jgi:hypothetical protein
MYIQTISGLGQAATTFDVNKAIRNNRIYGRTLGWQKYYDTILKFLGFTSKPAATDFAQGVAEWQQSQGLKADGMLGPSTWKVMQVAIIPLPTSTTAHRFLLKRGITSAEVWVVQRLLNLWLTNSKTTFPPLNEDGIFGSETEQVVRSFQRAESLSIDGLLGPQTWRRLLEKLIVLIQTQDTNTQFSQIETLSGFLLPQCFIPEVPDPRDRLIQTQFDGVVASNIAVARKITIPICYEKKLLEYAAHHLADGLILVGGFLRCPLYFKGGWVLKLVPSALAMTLNNRVFVDGSLDIETYVHEMVHVWQYKVLGISQFIASFLGMSALTVLIHWMLRRPLAIMRSNPHEVQAYNIEGRFMAWYRSHPCP